jgi:hypothetical protein
LDVPAGGETQLSDEIDESKTEDKRVARTEQFSLRAVRELQALLRHADRSEAEVPAPRVKVSTDGKSQQLAPDYPDVANGYKLLAEALGSTSLDFVGGLLCQLAMSTRQQVSESDLNFALSVVKDIKPNDQIEAMLAAQMAVIHMATMTSARRLAQVKTLAEHDSAERGLNKLARTYGAQMEALKRYRTRGEQKITVQHVSVNDGGQAIVGNVMHPQRADTRQPCADTVPALTDARQPPMPIIAELQGEGIPFKARTRR